MSESKDKTLLAIIPLNNPKLLPLRSRHLRKQTQIELTTQNKNLKLPDGQSYFIH